MPVLDVDRLIDERVSALKQAHAAAGLPRAQLDVSGGVDSAVVLGLLVLAVGPDNITAVHSRFNTDGTASERAKALARILNVGLLDLGLEDWLESFLDAALGAIGEVHGEARAGRLEVRIFENEDKTVLGSIRSTLRAPVGRALNRILGGGIRHGTGNEDEDRFLRFYQKGGDGEVDSNPIAMLSKGEVYQLARGLGMRLDAASEFRAVIEAVPSPDLWGVGDGHADEEELLKCTGAPFTYSRIDLDSGEYARVGTIERVSRFLGDGDDAVREALFDDSLTEVGLRAIIDLAVGDRAFAGCDPDGVEVLLDAARHQEHVTRHKWNPNIPTYGTRRQLVRDGILSNELP